MTQLEQQIAAAKKLYSETLQNLEKISDDIHSARRQERRREKKVQKLATAAVNERVIYHPLMDMASSSSSSGEDSGNETSGDVDSTELAAVPPLVGVVPVKNVTVRQIHCILQPTGAAHLPAVDSVRPPISDAATQSNSQTTAPFDVEPTVLASGIHRTPSLAESTSPVSPESDPEHLQVNAAVMAAVSRSKLQRVASPFLRPDACREDFSANASSDTESVSGSFVSGGLGALDDDQIESLMVDVTEYERIAADMDAAESDQLHQLTLPARLRHLQDFVKFEPVWIDDDCDNTVGGCQRAVTDVADDRVFADSDLQSHYSCHESVLDKAEKLDRAEADDQWHPLVADVSTTTISEDTEGHE